MSILRKASAKSRETSALIAGIAAFATWGLIPVYWKLLNKVPASEILAHRFVWTSLFLVGLLSWQHRWPEVKAVVRSRRATLYCLSSGLSIAINWFFFICAVNVGRVIETSLGYFMTPLVNVLFGAIFLRERLTRLQLISVLLAASGVLYLTFGYGRFPWIAVTLCTTFGLYGLLRKKSGTAAIPGLFLETVLLVPVAVAYLVLLKMSGTLRFRSRRLVVVDLVDQHRRRHRRAPLLVRIRRASSSPDHGRLPAISRADRLVLSRRLSLSRTVHARSSHHLRSDLDRARHFHLGSSHALALQSRARRHGKRGLRDAGLTGRGAPSAGTIGFGGHRPPLQPFAIRCRSSILR